MKKLSLVICVLTLSLLCTGVYAYTLTFDNIPDGDYLGRYGTDYGALFGGFAVTDHSNSLWGPPHSGNNVLTSHPLSSGGMLKF